jgi:hypothetical protein
MAPCKPRSGSGNAAAAMEGNLLPRCVTVLSMGLFDPSSVKALRKEAEFIGGFERNVSDMLTD